MAISRKYTTNDVVIVIDENNNEISPEIEVLFEKISTTYPQMVPKSTNIKQIKTFNDRKINQGYDSHDSIGGLKLNQNSFKSPTLKPSGTNSLKSSYFKPNGASLCISNLKTNEINFLKESLKPIVSNSDNPCSKPGEYKFQKCSKDFIFNLNKCSSLMSIQQQNKIKHEHDLKISNLTENVQSKCFTHKAIQEVNEWISRELTFMGISKSSYISDCDKGEFQNKIKKKLYECILCSKKFVYFKTLEKHMEKSHPEVSLLLNKNIPEV